MNVHVFKTSVIKENLKVLTPILDMILLNSKWNFDLEDCDNILRIESEVDISIRVCMHLTAIGFECIELD